MKNEVLYHYTLSDRLAKILLSQTILMSPRDSSELKEKEIPVVWLTVNPTWDKTAFLGYPLEKLDEIGRVRLTIENIPYTKATSLKKKLPLLSELIKSANLVNVNHNDWRISRKDIPIDKVTKIEKLIDNKWVKI